PCSELEGVSDFATSCSKRFKNRRRASLRIAASSVSSDFDLVFCIQNRRFVTSGLLRKSLPNPQHQRTNSRASFSGVCSVDSTASDEAATGVIGASGGNRVGMSTGVKLRILTHGA